MPSGHNRRMDVLSGTRAFVAVARRQSFSAAAHDEQTTQPVVSRRVAGLELFLGGALFDRSTRHVSLTDLGAALLGHAQALLSAESSLREAAEAHRRGTVRLLVPPGLDPARWAAVRLRAVAAGVDLDISEASREQRALRVRSGEADVAILPVETARADWVVSLGLAQATERNRSLTFASLRPTRAGGPRTASRIAVLPEEASPQLLSAVREAASANGLAPHQVHEASGVVRALTGALAGDDWILCTRNQADMWRLQWFKVRDLPVTLAYRLEGRHADGIVLSDPAVRRDIAVALGGESVEPS